MHVNARVHSSFGEHHTTLTTDDTSQYLDLPAKTTGQGIGTSGGELLFLALATCYCNDIYREAGNRGITVESVEVEVDGDFGEPGDPATGITYRASVTAAASEDEIRDLMRHTDTVAEIHNTLRGGASVTLAGIDAIPANEA